MPLEILRSPSAEEDLIQIWIYTDEHWGEAQADDYLSAIEASLLRVAEHPEIGADCSDIREGYRRISVGRHRVFYRVRGDAIEVMRVLHTSVDVPSHLGD